MLCCAVQGDSNTFLGEVMGDDDFESWARQEKAKQEEEDRADAQRQQQQAGGWWVIRCREHSWHPGCGS